MLLESHAGTCIQGYVYQILPVHVRRGTSTLVLLDIIGTGILDLVRSTGLPAHAPGDHAVLCLTHVCPTQTRDVLIARGRTRADRERRSTAVTPGKVGFFVCNGV